MEIFGRLPWLLDGKSLNGAGGVSCKGEGWEAREEAVAVVQAGIT